MGIDINSPSQFTSSVLSKKGIVIDATFSNAWESPSFSDFIFSGKLDPVVNNFVYSGGVLAMIISCNGNDCSYPDMDAWAPSNFVIKFGAKGGSFIFKKAPVTDYLKSQLMDYNQFAGNLYFIPKGNWTTLATGQKDGGARLIELKYGKGRIIVYAGHGSFWAGADRHKYYLYNKAFLKALLNYITTYTLK